jgi:hypothetical protein
MRLHLKCRMQDAWWRWRILKIEIDAPNINANRSLFWCPQVAHAGVISRGGSIAPYAEFPQHCIVPSPVTPQACWKPIDTASKWTSGGVVWPWWACPQHSSPLLSSPSWTNTNTALRNGLRACISFRKRIALTLMAHVFLYPTLTCINGPWIYWQQTGKKQWNNKIG